MVCQRCRGFLVCEMFNELSSDTDSLFPRCINNVGVLKMPSCVPIVPNLW